VLVLPMNKTEICSLHTQRALAEERGR